MSNQQIAANEIKKLQLKETVLFAMNNIPNTDPTTLKQFLELVNAGGTFGTISYDQILKKMYQVMKYIPGACPYSMLVMVDLLEIQMPRQLLLDVAHPKRLSNQDDLKARSVAFFVEATAQRQTVYAR